MNVRPLTEYVSWAARGYRVTRRRPLPGGGPAEHRGPCRAAAIGRHSRGREHDTDHEVIIREALADLSYVRHDWLRARELYERIDPDAAKVVRRLVRQGYEAYLVGGCVRDLLLDRRPKDFDVCTSARPDDVRRLFRNSRVIGRRFRLVHVLFSGGAGSTHTTHDDLSELLAMNLEQRPQ